MFGFENIQADAAAACSPRIAKDSSLLAATPFRLRGNLTAACRVPILALEASVSFS